MTLLRITAFCVLNLIIINHAVINQVARLEHPKKKQVVRLIGDYHEETDFSSDLPREIVHQIIIDNTRRSNESVIEYLNKHKETALFIECFNEEEVFKGKSETIKYFQSHVVKKPNSLCGITCEIPQKCKKPTRIHKADHRGYIGILHSITSIVLETSGQGATTGLLLRSLNKLEAEPFTSTTPHDIERELEQTLISLAAHKEIIDENITTAAADDSATISENLATLIIETNHLIEDFKTSCAQHALSKEESFIAQIKKEYIELLRLEIANAKEASEESQKRVTEKKLYIQTLIEKYDQIANAGNMILLSQEMDNSIAASILSSTHEDVLVATGYIHSKNIQDILLACGYQLSDMSQHIQSSWSAHDELESFKTTKRSIFSEKDKVRQPLILSDDFKRWLCQKDVIKAASQAASFEDGDFKE